MYFLVFSSVKIFLLCTTIMHENIQQQKPEFYSGSQVFKTVSFILAPFSLRKSI